MSYRNSISGKNGNNSNNNPPYISTSQGQMSPNKFQPSPTSSGMNYGNYSPQFQGVNPNVRMNGGNYQGQISPSHQMMNQGRTSPVNQGNQGLNPNMSPQMSGVNPNNQKSFVPFQPPRVSSYGLSSPNKYYKNSASPSPSPTNFPSHSPSNNRGIFLFSYILYIE